jgi:hypothetical protein
MYDGPNKGDKSGPKRSNITDRMQAGYKQLEDVDDLQEEFYRDAAKREPRLTVKV